VEGGAGFLLFEVLPGEVADRGGEVAAAVVLDEQGVDEGGVDGLDAGEDVGLFEAFVEAFDVVADQLGRFRDRLRGRRFPVGELVGGGLVDEHEAFEDAVLGHQRLPRGGRVGNLRRGRRGGGERVGGLGGAGAEHEPGADADQRTPVEPPALGRLLLAGHERRQRL
jgi:hypothetical protein